MDVPNWDSPGLIALIVLTFVLAGFVKGVIGLGLPAIAMGLLSLAMPPAQAAALLVVPSLVTNVWQLVAGPSLGKLARRLWSMMAGVCLGVWAGAGLMAGDYAQLATIGLGVTLIVYAITGLASIRLHVRSVHEAWLSPLIGATTGVVTAATGVFVIPAGPFLQAIGLEKEELVQALGLSFTVSTLALAVSLSHAGVLQMTLFTASLAVLIPALSGMFLGQWLRLRTRMEAFRKIFFIGLLGLGAYIAIRAAMQN
ncbi:MAG: sulfite exporter TauE/SafE family protein [Betaproteobacteria bacterium]|nr:sulfite exporter TauE/SafE family protein [Betaproteobacteria bacterium]